MLFCAMFKMFCIQKYVMSIVILWLNGQFEYIFYFANLFYFFILRAYKTIEYNYYNFKLYL